MSPSASLIDRIESIPRRELYFFALYRVLIASVIVALLSKNLAEEENADQLLNQVARSLMSVAKMPTALEQTFVEDDAPGG